MSFQSPPPAEAGQTVLRPSQPVFDARDLTGTEGTAFIVLDDKTYTLRITKAGKLILTK
jgi:hemin uptake protein HemP